MAKRKERIQNPESFIRYGTGSVKWKKKKEKLLKKQQKEGKLIACNITSKILKEALIQQKEEAEANNFLDGVEETLKFEEDDDDIDDFAGFSKTQTQFGEFEIEEINEDDDRLIEAFLTKEQDQQKTVTDLIVERIKEKYTSFASENRPVPKLDKSLIDLYKGVGTYLSRYTVGKIPKAFKLIPSLTQWEEALYANEPENWSPNALYQATRIFASNLSRKKVERFYELVLLPRVREDIRKNKRLHFALYHAMKKALYKPGPFFKRILLPLCESSTCTCREAVIIGSIIEKVSIPVCHSSAALSMLAGMEYCGYTSYFIKLLLEKKYSLPAYVVNAVVAHFTRFLNETRVMPVIWHQSLLAFVQRYKNVLEQEHKGNLRFLLEKQNHKSVTPEIIRELNHSRNRGEKEDDLMSISSPVSVINKTVEEDRFDIPDVPMEED